MSEKTKDFLHDYTDYIIVVGIILIVGIIIAWRLDFLFGKNNKPFNNTTSNKVVTNEKKSKEKSYAITISDNSSAEDVGNLLLEKKLIEDVPTFVLEVENLSSDTKIVPGKYNIDKGAKVADILNTITKTGKKSKSSKKVPVEKISFNVPEGALASDIASILKEKNLIKDEDKFVKRAEAMQMETLFRPGDYEIKSNANLDTVIKTIAHRN